jgi:ABC-type lipoprotein release transport system permease subunit
LRFSLFIAGRYLFAKKSHNVINVISAISAGGIAVGTAALIIILSVYNGFEDLLKSLYSTYESDLLIEPLEGKSFSPDTLYINSISQIEGVEAVCSVVEENIFVRYGSSESIATIKGVDSNFVSVTDINEYMREGEFSLFHGELPQAVLGRSMAFDLGLRVHFVDPLVLYFPSRNRPLSIVNPASSLNIAKVFPAGLFTIDQGFDSKYIFIPLSVARNLLEYKDQVTSLEIYTSKSSNIQRIKSQVIDITGDKYSVKDRFEQNETMYRMMRSEKLSIYIILLFILVIISCNLFGSLSMLIMEKKEDTLTLLSMGAKERLIKKIFIAEGWMISLSGLFAGTIIALLVCFLQQQLGIVPMPGNFVVESYPVVVKFSDIALTVTFIALIGLFSAMLPFVIIKNFKKI